jgi:hypothetical protein
MTKKAAKASVSRIAEQEARKPRKAAADEIGEGQGQGQRRRASAAPAKAAPAARQGQRGAGAGRVAAAPRAAGRGGAARRAPVGPARGNGATKPARSGAGESPLAWWVGADGQSLVEDFVGALAIPKAIPKNFGVAADLLYITREQRLKLAKVVDALENYERRMKTYFIDNLSKKASTGAAGHVARVQIVTADEPAAQDWEDVYKYIKKTGSFDLLNRAINRAAVRERWDNGKEIPGIGHFTVTKVSVTKV